MSLEHLDINDQLEVDAEVGLVRLAGRPAVVLDASTLGLLRKELVEQTGLEEARALLTRVGYAQGWRLGSGAAEDPFTPGLLGLFRMEPGVPAFLQGTQAGARFLELDSFEAEQHLAHLGPSRIPACWVICGLASGYLSRRQGRDVDVREERCAAQGAPRCRFQGRSRE
ncbi:MAG: AAA family ATPase, partial [Holophaga sp.]|nr:AAA family ATPase [Holophaga sp.]